MLNRGGWACGRSRSRGARASRSASTSSYDVNGWGASRRRRTQPRRAGSVGLSLAYLSGKDSKHDNELLSKRLRGRRLLARQLRPAACVRSRDTAAHVSFDGTRGVHRARRRNGCDRESPKANGTASSISAVGGLSYEIRSGRFSARPIALIEYYRLKEKGYTETGGGAAFDLTVDAPTSDETAASASLALGYDFSAAEPTPTGFGSRSKAAAARS